MVKGLFYTITVFTLRLLYWKGRSMTERKKVENDRKELYIEDRPIILKVGSRARSYSPIKGNYENPGHQPSIRVSKYYVRLFITTIGGIAMGTMYRSLALYI